MAQPSCKTLQALTLKVLKKSLNFFQQNGLKITIDANVVQANFIDVTFE